MFSCKYHNDVINGSDHHKERGKCISGRTGKQDWRGTPGAGDLGTGK